MLGSLLKCPSIFRALGQNVRFTSSASNSHVFEKIKLKKGDGEASADDFKNKAILLYFSAGWCPSCREFTPGLKEFYDHTKREGLQVVWLSRDRSEEDQQEYYQKNLPQWPYLPYGSKESRDFLQLYKIQTIPAIKLIGADGEVADDNVRVKIEKNHSDPEKSKQIVAEWKKKLGIE